MATVAHILLDVYCSGYNNGQKALLIYFFRITNSIFLISRLNQCFFFADIPLGV